MSADKHDMNGDELVTNFVFTGKELDELRHYGIDQSTLWDSLESTFVRLGGER